MKIITEPCMVCGKSSEMEVDTRGFVRWRSGWLIQDAFPDMPAELREQLKLGTHPACFESMFADVEDGDESPTTHVLAHNTQSGTLPDKPFVPLIIENPDGYPFEPGEREADWHEASDAEYQAYLDYWNKDEDDEYEPDDRDYDYPDEHSPTL
jgi:hypothetical protein